MMISWRKWGLGVSSASHASSRCVLIHLGLLLRIHLQHHCTTFRETHTATEADTEDLLHVLFKVHAADITTKNKEFHCEVFAVKVLL